MTKDKNATPSSDARSLSREGSQMGDCLILVQAEELNGDGKSARDDG